MEIIQRIEDCYAEYNAKVKKCLLKCRGDIQFIILKTLLFYVTLASIDFYEHTAAALGCDHIHIYLRIKTRQVEIMLHRLN